MQEFIGGAAPRHVRIAYFLATPALLWLRIVAGVCKCWYEGGFGPHDDAPSSVKAEAANSHIIRLETILLALDRVVTDTQIPGEDEDSLYRHLSVMASAIRAHSPVGQQEAERRRQAAANDPAANKES